MKSLTQFAPFAHTTEYKKIADLAARQSTSPDVLPQLQLQPQQQPAAHASPLYRVRQVQQQARSAWLSTMQSDLARFDLSGLEVGATATMSQASTAILEQLARHPQENAELIHLYEFLRADLLTLERDAPELTLHVHTNPAAEMQVLRQMPVHEHEHGGWLGALLKNPDPDEIGHAFLPVKHMLKLLFQGVRNLPLYYQNEARELLFKLSDYLSREQVSQSDIERIFDLTLYSVLLIPAGMGANAGLKDILHSWRQLGVVLSQRGDALKIRNDLSALAPAIAAHPAIQARRQLADENLALLDAQRSALRLTLVMGFGALFAGLSLLALSLMKFVAEGCSANQKCSDSVRRTSELAPAFLTWAAAGAAAIGAGIHFKSDGLKKKIASGDRQIRAAFSELLPPSVTQHADVEEEEMVLPREKKFHDEVIRKTEKYGRFSTSFTRINRVFFASSVLNTAFNLIEDGLFAMSRLGGEQARRNAVYVVSKILLGKDLAYTVIGAGMGLSSLQFFYRHGAMMKLDGARFEVDHEVDQGFHLLLDLLHPAAGFSLRAHAAASHESCHLLAQMLLHEIRLGINSRGEKKLSAADIEKGLEQLGPERALEFVGAIFGHKNRYRLDQLAQSDKMIRSMLAETSLDQANTDDLVGLYQQNSRDTLLSQQMLLLGDQMEMWQAGERPVDERALAKGLTALLSGRLYDPLAEEQPHQHLSDKLLGLFRKKHAGGDPHAAHEAGDARLEGVVAHGEDGDVLTAAMAGKDDGHFHAPPAGHRQTAQDAVGQDGIPVPAPVPAVAGSARPDRAQVGEHDHGHATVNHDHDHAHDHGHSHSHAKETVYGALAEFLAGEDKRFNKIKRLMVFGMMGSVALRERVAPGDEADSLPVAAVPDFYPAPTLPALPAQVFLGLRPRIVELPEGMELQTPYAHLEREAQQSADYGLYGQAMTQAADGLALARDDGDLEKMDRFTAIGTQVGKAFAQEFSTLTTELRNSLGAGGSTLSLETLQAQIADLTAQGDRLMTSDRREELSRLAIDWVDSRAATLSQRFAQRDTALDSATQAALGGEFYAALAKLAELKLAYQDLARSAA